MTNQDIYAGCGIMAEIDMMIGVVKHSKDIKRIARAALDIYETGIDNLYNLEDKISVLLLIPGRINNINEIESMTNRYGKNRVIRAICNIAKDRDNFPILALLEGISVLKDIGAKKDVIEEIERITIERIEARFSDVHTETNRKILVDSSNLSDGGHVSKVGVEGVYG